MLVMNVCVFCAGNEIDIVYTKPAGKLAQLLGQAGHTLVWGGIDEGLMKVMADGVSNNGGSLLGISVEFLRPKTRRQADEMIFAKDIGERKSTMIERSDIFVLLVGGIGALSETTDVLVGRKHKQHKKPLVVLNTADFYSGLKLQLEHMRSNGFLSSELDDAIYFAETPQEVLDYIEKDSI